MKSSKSLVMLGAAAALAMSAGFGAPSASRSITVGDDRTRYTYKAKDKPKTSEGIIAETRAAIARHQQRQAIAEWNASVDAKKNNKRARRAVVKATEKRWAREDRQYSRYQSV